MSVEGSFVIAVLFVLVAIDLSELALLALGIAVVWVLTETFWPAVLVATVSKGTVVAEVAIVVAID